MNQRRKPKNFIDLPKLPGGKKDFQSYIINNLKYPKQALEHRIEGFVYVEFTVNDMGRVVDAKVEKGIGYGCDEEAIRLIKNLSFQKTRKQGVRVKKSFKTKIEFRISQPPPVSYQYKVNEKDVVTKGKKSYSYSISINK